MQETATKQHLAHPDVNKKSITPQTAGD